MPHHPHDEVVVVSRGAGSGAAPPVSTVTTLNAVSTAEPVAQYRTVWTGAPASRPSVKQKPTASS